MIFSGLDVFQGRLISYSTSASSPSAKSLQRFLNSLPGIFVKEDGIAGAATSDACKRALGVYLQGDPRINV